MPKYGVISNNEIINMINADSLEDAELLSQSSCVLYTQDNPIAIGFKYNGAEWIAPIVTVEEPNA